MADQNSSTPAAAPSTVALRSALQAARSMKHFAVVTNALEDTHENVVAKVNSENEARDSRLGTNDFDEIFEAAVVPDEPLTPESVCHWILSKGIPFTLLALLKVTVVTLICVAVLAPRYERGPQTKGAAIATTQLRYALGRCVFGAVIGRILIWSVRKITSTEFVAEHMMLALIFDAMEVLPLEVIGNTCGLLLGPRIARLAGIAIAFGGRRLHRAIRQRLKQFLISMLVLGLTYLIQRILMGWLLRRWTAGKFAEKISSALACRRIVHALAEVAEAEKDRIEQLRKKKILENTYYNQRQVHHDDEEVQSKASAVITGLLRRYIMARRETDEIDTQERNSLNTIHEDHVEVDVTPREKTGFDASDFADAAERLMQNNRNSESSLVARKSSQKGKRSFSGYEHATRTLRLALNLSSFGSLDSSDDSRKVGRLVFRLLRSAAQDKAPRPGGSHKPIPREILQDLILGPDGPLGHSETSSSLLNRKLARPGSKVDTMKKTEALHDKENEAAFEELFPPAVFHLTETELIEPFLRVYRERSFLSATISSFGSMNLMLVRVAELIWLLFAIIFLLIYWKIDVTDVTLVFGSLSLGLSFAFGSSIAQLCTGMFYVLFTNPYDIGDRVIVADVGVPQSTFPMFVTSISTYTTTFSTSFGEVVTIANYLLSQKQVFNHGRSPKPALRLPIKLSMRTPPTEFSKLCSAIQHFARSHRQDWTEIALYFASIEHDNGAIVLELWACSRHSYADFTNLYGARTRLFLFIHAYINATGLHFVPPTQPVDISGANGPLGNFTNLSAPPFDPSADPVHRTNSLRRRVNISQEVPQQNP